MRYADAAERIFGARAIAVATWRRALSSSPGHTPTHNTSFAIVSAFESEPQVRDVTPW
jgi:hypothetical protein